MNAYFQQTQFYWFILEIFSSDYLTIMHFLQQVLKMEENNEPKENIAYRTFKVLKKNRKKIMVLLWCIKVVLACLIDWVLYLKFNALEPGLVYGPINNSILYSLLVLCCIGTVVSVADLVNKLVEKCHGEPIMNIAYTELCVVYLEDIPQLNIGLFIVLCAGEYGVLLTTKAIMLCSVVGLMGLVVYPTDSGSLSLRSIMRPKLSDNKERKCSGFFRLGVLVVCILNVVVCFSVAFNDTPKGLLDNVGIYGDTSEFELSQNYLKDSTWMYFFSVKDMKRHGEVMSKITTDPSHIRIQNFFTNGNDTDTCYRLIGTNATNDAVFREESNCSILHGTELYYRFKYLPPSRRHRLGDIQYNVRKSSTGSCHNATFQQSQLRYLRGKANGHLEWSNRKNNTAILNMLWKDFVKQGNLTYNKYRASLARQLSLNRYRFHSAESLSDVRHEWGKASCHKSDGSPHFNQDISVPCLP